MRTTDEAIDFLRDIDTINYGGCLIAAYTFYLNEKREGRDANLQIVALADSKKRLQTNEKYLKGKNDCADSAPHFGWTYDNGKTVYDTDGENGWFKTKLVIPKELTEEFAVSALNNGVWNNCFDREYYLPKIEKYFNLDFSNIEVW